MAEAGGDPLENPFSFRKFVSKKGSPTDENERGDKASGGDDICNDTESGAAVDAGGKSVKVAEGWSHITLAIAYF